jgi:PPOX class probable F420-dependent enzyme
VGLVTTALVLEPQATASSATAATIPRLIRIFPIMSAIPDSARELLESGRLAHFVTVNANGTPQVTCVWVGVEGDEIVYASLPHNQKVRNLERNPRVVLSMEGEGRTPIGLTHYLVVSGRARVEPGGAPELLQKLAARYLGPGVKFPAMPNPPPGYVVRITPERFSGNGPWVTR